VSDAAQTPPTRPEVSPLRLIGTLGSAGALAGLLLVFVHQLTAPAIAAHKQRVLEESIGEVLGAPARYETLYLHEDALTAELPAGVDGGKLPRIYRGYDAEDKVVGYAIARSEAGFADQVKLIFGYDAATNRVLGMKVLESKETPGLGDKIEKDDEFVGQFSTREAAGKEILVGVKKGDLSGDKHEVEMITGATISSKVVIRIINNAIEEWEPLLQ